MIKLDETGVADLKKLKHKIDENFKRGSALSIHKELKKIGWNSPDVNGLVYKDKIVKKTTLPDSRSSIYEWVGGEPSIQILKEIRKYNSILQKERRQNYKAKKLAEKAQEPENKTSPVEQTQQEAAPIRQELTKPKLDKKPAQEITIPDRSGKIPITVDVTTEGDSKTVVIKIIV